MSKEIIHHYALLGLSKPNQIDYVLGEEISFKLSNNEKKYFFEESEINLSAGYAVKDALEYFKKEFPSGNVYYRNSRYAGGGSLQYLEFENVLNDLTVSKEQKRLMNKSY